MPGLPADRPRVPGSTVSLFTRPAKMPGFSWSLPAVLSCIGVQFGPNTGCGTCYANPDSVKEWGPSLKHPEGGHKARRHGSYGNPNVRHAQEVRWQWTQESMMTADGRDSWVKTMIAGIRHISYRPRGFHRYFRVHDSGDLFSPEYVRCWVRVCAALPEIRFWFPTRSWNVEKPGLPPLKRAVLERTAAALVELAELRNVTVRPSAIHVDVPAPVVPGLHAGTGIARKGYTCPSSRQGNSCGTCRRCWNAKESAVTYKLH